MVSFPKYESYKSSGVEWLGDIPSHWDVIKFSRVAYFQEGPGLRNWQFTDDGVKVICVTNICPPSIDFTKLTKFISLREYENKYQHFTVKTGDLLLASSGASWGKVAEYQLNDTVILNTSTIRINSLNKQTITRDFIKYILQSQYISDHLSFLLTGSCQPNFGPTHLNKLICVVPKCLEEQEKIAKFLDEKTAEIEEAITHKQRLIELLLEQKAILINQAVTKGLNPTVPMRDSGIQWLGDIPEHWEIRKLKWFAKTDSGSTPNSGQYSKYYKDGQINWVRTLDLNNGEVKETEIQITDKALKDTACKIMPINTVMIAMYGGDGTIGKNGILKIESTVNQAICGIVTNSTCSPSFLHKYIQFYRPYWMIDAMGARKDPNISQNIIRELMVVFPSLEEQEEIVNFIDKKESETDEAINLIKQQIDKLNELKQILISNAVTGKIKVL